MTWRVRPRGTRSATEVSTRSKPVSLWQTQISIVTPSFNQAAYLGLTLESVARQRYPHLQYIVVDGGSTDDSLEVIKRHSEGLDRWVSEPDRGQAHALNKGFAWARGDVVGWINSDDLLAEGALSVVGAFFDANPDSIWCTGACELIDAEGMPLDVLAVDPGLPPAQWLLHMQHRRAAILQPSTFWRRAAGEAVGPLREDLHCAFDFEFFYRLRERFGPPAQLDVVLSKFRLHDASKTVATHEMFLLEMLEIVREKVRALPVAERAIVYEWLQQQRTRECFLRQQIALRHNRHLQHWQWRARGWAHRLLG
ncbi:MULTISPECIES: glycosyltransferase family 2 protein [Aphanothece]|uniref:glycosyltransferase family 2 protein n=1 Tax=Aphanothece TaxID=1121 RepID=UPI003984619B